jgi:hypothetical protein
MKTTPIALILSLALSACGSGFKVEEGAYVDVGNYGRKDVFVFASDGTGFKFEARTADIEAAKDMDGIRPTREAEPYCWKAVRHKYEGQDRELVALYDCDEPPPDWKAWVEESGHYYLLRLSETMLQRDLGSFDSRYELRHRGRIKLGEKYPDNFH